MTTETHIKEDILSSFLSVHQGDTPCADGYRAAAFADFSRLGFPSRKDEQWRYTPILDISKATYPLYHIGEQDHESTSYQGLCTEIRAHRLVFVNGRFQAEASVIMEESKGVIISSTSVAQKTHPTIFESYYNQLANNGKEAFIALNTAFSVDGAFVYVPKKTKLNYPIFTIYLTDIAKEEAFVYDRNLIIAESESSVSIVEEYKNVGTSTNTVNSYTEVFLAQNARVDIACLQDEPNGFRHICTKEASQARDSFFKHTSISMAGKLIRNNIHTTYKGTNCDCDLQGLYMGKGTDLIDNHVAVYHQHAHSESNQLFKGILDARATGVFNGKIYVNQDAQKTNAYQSNKNILLSDTATINTKPQLEIFADDVKCSHGATCGQIDQEALFYLITRGIPPKKAKALLIYAFALEVVNGIELEAVQAYVNQDLKSKLGLEF